MNTEMRRPGPDPEDIAAVVRPWAALAALAPQAVRLVPVAAEGGGHIEFWDGGCFQRVGWLDRLGGVSLNPCLDGDMEHALRRVAETRGWDYSLSRVAGVFEVVIRVPDQFRPVTGLGSSGARAFARALARALELERSEGPT